MIQQLELEEKLRNYKEIHKNKSEETLLYNIIQKDAEIKNLEFKLFKNIKRKNMLNQSMHELRSKENNFNIDNNVRNLTNNKTLITPTNNNHIFIQDILNNSEGRKGNFLNKKRHNPYKTDNPYKTARLNGMNGKINATQNRNFKNFNSNQVNKHEINKLSPIIKKSINANITNKLKIEKTTKNSQKGIITPDIF